MYGLLKYDDGQPVIEVHEDLTTASVSLGYHRHTVARWLRENNGHYSGNGFVITTNTSVSKSGRGLPKGTDPRSLRDYS